MIKENFDRALLFARAERCGSDKQCIVDFLSYNDGRVIFFWSSTEQLQMIRRSRVEPYFFQDAVELI
jgi:hypothetical protein